jgi:hypothetical protein
MPSAGMWRRVASLKTDFLEEFITSIITGKKSQRPSDASYC